MTRNQQQVSSGAGQLDAARRVENLLNEQQAARVLGVSPRTLWGLADSVAAARSEPPRTPPAVAAPFTYYAVRSPMESTV
jgi:hypothetical protein